MTDRTAAKDTAHESGEPMAAARFTAAEVPDKHLYRVTEAMMLLSISRSAIYEQLRIGRLRSVKQGRTRLIPASAIREYVELLETEAQEVNHGKTA